ncbi:MAG: HipA N-terminal domain-containing protein [Elusimicrobia bacterium]|nr:HipA N-terminal domain-containing protein [Elusimicrobiota bacterium]
MENTPLKAAVFFQGRRAGVLSKKAKGYEFIYDSSYLNEPNARAISLSFSLRVEKFESPRLFSFFDGLLPEGWLLELTSTAAKIDKDDKFRLLLHTGRDPIGAVSVKPLGGDENE